MTSLKTLSSLAVTLLNNGVTCTASTHALHVIGLLICCLWLERREVAMSIHSLTRASSWWRCSGSILFLCLTYLFLHETSVRAGTTTRISVDSMGRQSDGRVGPRPSARPDTGASRVGLQTPPLTKGMLSTPLEPQHKVPRPKGGA
jgi:hypothetical protein